MCFVIPEAGQKISEGQEEAVGGEYFLMLDSRESWCQLFKSCLGNQLLGTQRPWDHKILPAMEAKLGATLPEK